MEKIKQEDIVKELIGYIKNNILDSSVSISADTVLSQVGLDSMSIIELVLFIERKFGVALPEEDLIPENLKSVNTLTIATLRHL